MKCHILNNIVFLRSSLFILLLSGAVVTKQAQANIDKMTCEIAQHLRYTPDLIVGFERFAADFENGLRAFLDKSNVEPLPVHIARLEKLLADFRTGIVENPLYATVKKDTQEIHKRFSSLAAMLKKYIGKKNSHIALMGDLAAYQQLVPKKVKDEVGLSFIGALRHRVNQ